MLDQLWTGLQVAFLNFIWAIAKGAAEFLVEMMGEMLKGLNGLVASTAVMGAATIGPDLTVSAGPGVLGTLLDAVAATAVQGIAAIKPLAYMVLAVMLGIQSVKIMQQPDSASPSGVPYIEKFAWMWVTFAVMKVALDYSVDLTLMVFNEMQRVTGSLFGATGAVDASAIDGWASSLKAQIAGKAFSADDLDSAGRTLFMYLGSPLLVFAGLTVLYVVVTVSMYGRWIQTYFYLTFAPLMFSFAGLDETRPMLVGYLKSILCCALAFFGTLLMLETISAVYVPFVLSQYGSVEASWADLLMTFGAGLLLTFALGKVGGWVRDLVG